MSLLLAAGACMLELKFTICHRAALTGFQPALFKHRVKNGWRRLSLSPCKPTIFLIQQSWIIAMFCY